MPNETEGRDAGAYTVHPSPNTSEVLANITVGIPVVMLLMSVIAALKNHWRARQSEEIISDGKGLSPGLVTLRGSPEPRAPQAPMVSVTITQLAEERSGKNPHHVWKEVGRKTETHPFYLRLPSGEKLKVEP